MVANVFLGLPECKLFAFLRLTVTNLALGVKSTQTTSGTMAGASGVATLSTLSGYQYGITATVMGKVSFQTIMANFSYKF